MKKTIHCILFAIASMAMPLAVSAGGNPFSLQTGTNAFTNLQLAGPPHGKHWHKYHGGGPPPWAPAHGYRRKAHAHYHEYGLPAPPIDFELGRCNREVMGQILGGVAGGVIGAQIGDGTGRLIAVAAGTVLGMIAGREIGRRMDRADALCVDQALEHANAYETIRWQHDDYHYSVTPYEAYETRGGEYCRQYTMRTVNGGPVEQVTGTACRQEDGSWRIVNR